MDRRETAAGSGSTSGPSDEGFSVGVTAAFAGSREVSDPGLLAELDGAGLAWEIVAPADPTAIGSEELARHAAWLVGNEWVTADAVGATRRAPLILSRFGVGTDRIDLGACTRRGVIVSITPDAMARPVAVAALAHILAATLNLVAKDAMVRDGAWDRERRRWLGRGLEGRTVGLIGLGNVGAVLVELLVPLRVRVLAADPNRTPGDAARLGVGLVSLDTLLEASDVVVVLCPLTPATHHLIGATQLARMRPAAVLVNVARGPIVDQEALTDALTRGTIAGAGLDVFEDEPLPAGHPLTRLPNVSLSPHGLAQTDQLLEGAAASAIAAILDVSRGRMPRFVANPDVAGDPTLVDRLSARARATQGRCSPGSLGRVT